MELTIIILQVGLIIALLAQIKLLRKDTKAIEDFSIKMDAVTDDLRSIKPYLEAINRRYESEKREIGFEMARQRAEFSKEQRAKNK